MAVRPKKGRGVELPIPATRVGVTAFHLVEIAHIQSASAHDPIVRDHHGSDGAKQAPVADQPGKDVGANVVEENPGERDDAEDSRYYPTGPERDVFRR